MQSARARQRQVPASKSRAARCKSMAKDGAYSKAVSAVTSEMADLDAEQQRSWAGELLPLSSRPEQAVFSAASGPVAPDADTQQADEQHADNQAQGQGSQRRHFRHSLHGVKFAALSAAGPSGAHPEHIKEMLSIRQRSIANKLYKAIGVLRDAGEAGTLPKCARWILGSRLAFIKKKVGPKPRPSSTSSCRRALAASDCQGPFQQGPQQGVPHNAAIPAVRGCHSSWN